MAEDMELVTLEFVGDPSKIPTRRQLPVGDLIVSIKGFQSTKSRATSELSEQERAAGKVGGKVAIAVQIQVDQPESYKGIVHTHTFWIGSDDDPEARKEVTWRRNGVDLMKMFKEAGVTMTASTRLNEAQAAAIDQKVGVHTYLKNSKRLDPKTGQPYPSRPEVGSWWKPGSREIAVMDDVEFGGAAGVGTTGTTVSF